MCDGPSYELLPDYLNDLGVNDPPFGDQGYFLDAVDLGCGMETNCANKNITAFGEGTVDPKLLFRDHSLFHDTVDLDLDMETSSPNGDITTFGEGARNQPTNSKSNLKLFPDPCTSTSISTMPLLNQMATPDSKGASANVSSARSHVNFQNPIAAPGRQRISAIVPMHMKAGVKKHMPAPARQRVSATLPILMNAGFQKPFTDSTPQPLSLPVHNPMQVPQMPVSSQPSPQSGVQQIVGYMYIPRKLHDFQKSLEPQQQSQLQDCLTSMWSYYVSHPQACILHHNPSSSRAPPQINTFESIPSPQHQRATIWTPPQTPTVSRVPAKPKPKPGNKVFHFAKPEVPENFVANPTNHGRWSIDSKGKRTYLNAPKSKTTSSIQNA